MKKASMEEKAKAVKSGKVPPCRFWFLHVVVLYIMVGLETVRKKIRRRGKSIVVEPTIASTNEHNEYGLVAPERPQPFRSPSSDVACAADRCNVDFRIMARGFPEGGDIERHVRRDAQSLARCFPDIAYRDVTRPLVRRMAYSVVALHMAAHNCDYYITKYASKALEQLQNLVTQYAIGVRRLEEKEKQEAAAGVEPKSAKERASRILIGLQNAANRCHWFSSTELAVFLKTGDMFWT